ncbi:MAG: hypothetical protein AAB332_00795 [Planctomycetota bacterium]
MEQKVEARTHELHNLRLEIIRRLSLAAIADVFDALTAESVKQSVVPTGLKILAYSPTDKSVGYFHLSLRDKTQICKKSGMLPILYASGGL